IIELLNCNALAIYIINKDGAGFNNYANYNLDDEFHKGMIENGEFFWKVIRERKSSVITNKTNDIKNFPQLLSKYNFASCFGIPLILRGTPIGALFLFFNSKKRYTKEEIKFSEAIANQLVVAFEKINSLDRIKEMNLNTVLALVRAIEIRDPYTKGHSLQVSELAFELGKYIDLSNRQLELIKFAGLLHDVGKIAISESILNKPAPLNDYEWAIMKKHPEKSVEIIRPISDLREIETWILYHHERWDGTGYPEGKKDKEIPIGARILAVCDTFSAMTSDRPYRKALSLEETIEEIKNYKGKQFEPEIVDIFLKLPEEFLRRVIKKILTM
ncbi:MAG: HD domain-containing phosphohydrolase, partial [candidate division WOR-3 bacterium]